MKAQAVFLRWLPVNQSFLQLINIRPGEGERTLLMFAFYTATSMGILWLEVSSAALFLDAYGASSLPWIYVFSAGVGFALSMIYSWLQCWLSLRRVIVLIALMMSLPILFFRWGLTVPALLGVIVFAMRLWIEAIYSLNDLNISVTANQLFNIREVKRTYPIISSGNLIADVLSGFSIYLVLDLVGLENVLLMSCAIMIIGTGILYYLTEKYEHAFPEARKRQNKDTEKHHNYRKLEGSIRYYFLLLIASFILSQILLYSIEFQFLDQLERNLGVAEIASFLGVFSGVLGLTELITQWFTSSRLIERQGVFSVILILPSAIIILGILAMMASHPMLLGSLSFFVSIIILKFFDEWLRYTLVASTRPVLFQPIPEQIRSEIQSLVGGIAEPLSMGGTGIAILLVISLCNRLGLTNPNFQTRVFLGGIIFAALIWFGIIYLLRSRYLDLLVLSAERGLLSFSDANLRVLKKAIIEQLESSNAEADQQSCIELLTYIDPRGIGEILINRLEEFPPSLQKQSLEAMLKYPNPEYSSSITYLLNFSEQPEVIALALRYVWITQDSPSIAALRTYLKPEVDPLLRGTAISLMMRRGNQRERAEATETLRKMLTHQKEHERVIGCQVLGEVEYMQALRIYIPILLRDNSLRVRQEILGAIASTHLSEYYPSLIKALQYKSTREASIEAITRLGNDALPMLESIATDKYRPEILRNQAWRVIGNIGSFEALEILTKHLVRSWGNTRRWILRILLSIFLERGVKRSDSIDLVLDQQLGRNGIENLIDAEIDFLVIIISAKVDLTPPDHSSKEVELLENALDGLETDSIERCLMLLKFISPPSAIQAAQVSLNGSSGNKARGIEILDNALDITSKRSLLILLDYIPNLEKLKRLSLLSGSVNYQPQLPGERLRELLEIRDFLSDWSLACCFHVAKRYHWNLTTEHTLDCLQHPTSFVREAALSYIQMVSPKSLHKILPLMQQDPNELVAAQVQQLLANQQTNSA